ncbi:uncharacterized protein LOC143032901 [Oratosquilla oratoria]|uniref:uncharacterized protein LOC143032901 n=1 Tax=Oratosquilla oratoria TaxID=337810 RepID=UPI003F77232E
MALRLTMVAFLLVGVWAVEQEHSANQLNAEGDDNEGRGCQGHCGVIEPTAPVIPLPTTGVKPTIDYQPLLTGLETGLSGLGWAMTSIPLLALNIAGIVLLAIIVHHLVKGGDTGPAYDYYSYSAYQPSSSGYSGGSGGHVGHGDGSGYGRSLATPLFSMETVNGIFKKLLDAVDKYEAADA